MKTQLRLVWILFFVLTGSLVGAVHAQDPLPPPSSLGTAPGEASSWGPELGQISGPYRMPDGLWVMPKGAYPPLEAAGISPQATGGPDDFGYTWNDSVPLNWIDATGGTDTGMSGISHNQKVGPIPLPFSFKFYENTYNSVYIAASGYLAFTDEGTWPWQPRIPSPAAPNNVIAPYATPLDLAISGPANRVYYASGGAAPNRYFVVEWYQVASKNETYKDETYTYEVILHENGDIVFQYLTMNYSVGGWFCGAAGIEDSTGLDGLAYVSLCQQAPSNKAVRFYRPTPSARAGVRPAYQGRFSTAGTVESFQVTIRNIGEFGTDTYDLTPSSTWPASLYATDGVTPLTDTDGDGMVDTGPVAQGSTVTITAKVATPGGAGVGDNNTATITVHSSLNTTRSKIATLQTAIPASFAQVYQENADGAMSLYLVQPAAQAVKKATSDRYYGYYSPAVAEAPNGNFVYVWTKWRCLDNTCSVYAREIEYALLDRYGQVVRGVTKLTNHSGAMVNTYDSAPAVVVAPSGRIGVLWYRYLWDRSTSRSNYNIWFAILEAAGNRVYGPVNLTNNTAWGTRDDLNVPRFYFPRIAATGDDRFVLAWERQYQESSGWVNDIYYAIRDAAGGQVKPVTQFTQDTPGWDQDYSTPALAALSSNRVLMAWGQRENDSSNIAYAVMDSSGNVVKPATTIPADGQRPDAVQLSDGRIVIAWNGWLGDKLVIEFAVLNGATYDVAANPTRLSNPAAPGGDAFVSIAADAAGRAILTWMDYNSSYRRNLYYALVDGDGDVLTPPMIFRTSQAASSYIETSYEGSGNTSYSWTPPSGVDGVVAFGASLFGGRPGGTAAVSVRYANHGATTATGVVLTATLDGDLTYVGDTTGVVPTASGNQVVWNLPDLQFLDSQAFTLYVRVPSGAAYGSRYPVTLTLSSNGPEANAADNAASAAVMAARQLFLPLMLRNH